MPVPIVAPRPIGHGRPAPAPASGGSCRPRRARPAARRTSAAASTAARPAALLLIDSVRHTRSAPRTARNRVQRASLSQRAAAFGTRPAPAGPCASIARPATPDVAGESSRRSSMSTAASPKVTPPAAGREDHHRERQARTSRTTRSSPSSRATGRAGHLARQRARHGRRGSQKAYGGKRRIHWMEVYAGEKANRLFNTWLPDETVAACREYLVSIKGPLTTPVGGGIRSLNVALRQMLDLYVCLRPVRWFKGVPSPGEAPGEGRHGDLPREHRGHLRRHRVRGRHPGQPEVPRAVPPGLPQGLRQDPLSRTAPASASSRSRRKARSASSARPSSTRSPTSARA